MKKVFSKTWPLLVGCGLIAIDMQSKAYALTELSQEFSSFFPYGGKALFSKFLGGVNFSLNLVKNKGAAWGLFSQYPQMLALIRLLIVLFLIVQLFKSTSYFVRRIGFILVCSGAIGNLIDYYKYGFVVDMFHFTFWNYDFPVFNVADSCIFLGVMILAFSKSPKRI